jgi:hypothetical protein
MNMSSKLRLRKKMRITLNFRRIQTLFINKRKRIMQENREKQVSNHLWLDSNELNLDALEACVESAFGATWERGVFGVKVQVSQHIANLKIYLLDHSADEFVEESLNVLEQEYSGLLEIRPQVVYGVVPCRKVVTELVA